MRLNPQEGRDQSMAIISSGMKQIDEDLRKGGGLLKDRSALGGGRGDRGWGTRNLSCNQAVALYGHLILSGNETVS